MHKIIGTVAYLAVVITMLFAIQDISCASANIGTTVRGDEEDVAAFQSAVMFWGDVSSYGANIGAGISKSDFLYKPEEKIDIVLAIHNSSAEPIPFSTTKVDNDYQVIVNDESGNPVPLTDYGKQRAINVHELSRVIFKTLKTDEVFLDRFPLNEYYDMTKPGLYSISVTRDMQQAGNHDELMRGSHLELGPIWIAIDNGSILDGVKSSLVKQLVAKLSTSKSPNAMVAVRPSIKNNDIQVMWTSGARKAVLYSRSLRAVICAYSNILTLGDSKIKMIQKAKMIGEELCIPQGAIVAINNYFSEGSSLLVNAK